MTPYAALRFFAHWCRVEDAAADTFTGLARRAAMDGDHSLASTYRLEALRCTARSLGVRDAVRDALVALNVPQNAKDEPA